MSITLTMSKRYLEQVFQRAWELEIKHKDEYEAIRDRLKTTRAYTLWIFPTTQLDKVTGDWSYWWVNAMDKGYISRDEYEFVKAYKSLWVGSLREVLRDSPADDKVQVSIDIASHIRTLEKNCSDVSYYGGLPKFQA